MRKRKSKLLPIVIVLLVAGGVGFGVYLAGHRASPPASAVVETRQTPPAGEQKTQEVEVYSVVVENNQPRLHASKQTVAQDGDPIELTLNKLIEQGSSGDVTNPIPKGTKLLGVDVKDGLAKVDFSKEFRENFTGGSEGEGLIIQVITRTMSQFDQVKKVRILVEGKPIDTLGHADLSEPLDVRWVSSEFSEKE